MSAASEFVFVYTTVSDEATAHALAEPLIAKGLAACVNCIPGVVSHYVWNQQAECAAEVIVLVKTRRALLEPVLAELGARHPYETPALLVLPIESLNDAYRAWALQQTQGG